MHDIFKRHLGYKVLSFILALLFWLYVTNQQGTSQAISGDQSLTVLLVTKGQPQDIIIISTLPSVQIQLEGSPGVTAKDLFAYIDLSEATPGEHQYQIQVEAPEGVKVKEIQPQQVTVQLDTVQEKVLPVQVKYTGSPAPGYEVGAPIVKPSAVNVRGPSSILNMLDKAIVEVSVAGADETFQVSYPVLFRDKADKPIYGPDPRVDVLSAFPSSVDVTVPVNQQGLAAKEVPVRAKSEGTPAEGMALRALTLTSTSVQVVGTPEALAGFESLTIGPVDISNLTEDKVFQISSDKVSLPQGVSFKGGTTFTVVADIGPEMQQKTISGVPVNVKNIPEGLELEQNIAPLDITVQGWPEDLKTITADQLQLWVDASGLSAGSYPETKVYYQLPPDVTLVSQPQVLLGLKAQTDNSTTQ